MDELKYSVYEVRFQIKTVVYSLKMLVTGQASKDSSYGTGWYKQYDEYSD